MIVLVAIHWAEGEELLALVRQGRPGWLLAGAALQVGTYLAAGAVWQGVLRRGERPLGLAQLARLAIAKLFVDQAMPSAGISGTLVVVQGLRQRAVPRPVAVSAIVVDLVSHYIALSGALALALALASARAEEVRLVAVPAGIFAIVAVAVPVALLRLSAHPPDPARLPRIRALRRLLDTLAQARPDLIRDRGLLARAVLFQLTIITLDTSTRYAMHLALGLVPDLAGVFAAMMLGTLARIIGIVPGGLGTFEAVTVATLHASGVSVAGALAATLLFRGLSFWLPLLPGLWAARRETARLPPRGQEATS